MISPGIPSSLALAQEYCIHYMCVRGFRNPNQHPWIRPALKSWVELRIKQKIRSVWMDPAVGRKIMCAKIIVTVFNIYEDEFSPKEYYGYNEKTGLFRCEVTDII